MKTWQKKLVLGPILAPLAQIRSPKIFHKFCFNYMLDIIASYHFMQFHGKLMKQTWENDKKPTFRPDFGPLPIWPKFGPTNFFSKIWLRQSLDIVVSHHHIQYQKKLVQSWENLVPDWQTDRWTDGGEWFHMRLSD